MAEDAAKQGALFDDAPGDEQVVSVGARCVLRTRDGRRVVVVAGVPAYHYPVGDAIRTGTGQIRKFLRGRDAARTPGAGQSSAGTVPLDRHPV